MSIPGLDAYLTSAPEEPDWIEEAEKVVNWTPRDEREANLLAIIDNLKQLLLDEMFIYEQLSK
jgi:hypothetical protein